MSYVPHSSKISPSGFSRTEPEKFCAYNQTRKRFLSANVEVADFSPTILQERLPVLAQGTDFALWHLPFRGISPTLVSEPIDLVYLDENCVVLEAVESFPISQVSSSSRPATSVLALKAGTIETCGTQSGDHLLLYGAEEMKRRLKQSAKEVSRESMEHLAELNRLSSSIDLSKEIRSNPKPFIVDPAAITQATGQSPASGINSVSTVQKTKKSWLQWLFEPLDARSSKREALTWLVAYFYTGEVPVPHKVRDVGLSGIYIYTDERWSPDTIIRLTLTDAREPIANRSMTLNARVIRWGNDGVGFKFVLKNPRARRSQSSVEDMVEGATREEVAKFLERVRFKSV